VDTLFGDGADGNRSARRPVAALFAELGWGDWRNVDPAAQLYGVLADRMGSERVGWAKEGFNELAGTASKTKGTFT
jgi:hypothetical protein